MFHSSAQAVVLENKRVKLRPLELTDFDNLKRFSIEQPELWKYSFVTAAGGDNLLKYLHQAISEREKQKEYPFIIFDKQPNAYAGCTRFYNILPAYQTLDLGYTWYGKEFHGTGLNENCKFLLLQYAFETLNIDRVEFRADFENKRSIAAMKKIGCVEEGVIRSHMPKPGGGRRDSIILSILKHEWENDVKQKLLKLIE